MSAHQPRPMSLVLLTDPALEFVDRLDVTMTRPPGVVIITSKAAGVEDRVFMYVYQENGDSYVYRETVAVMT